MKRTVIQYKEVHDDYATWRPGDNNLEYRFRPWNNSMYFTKGKDAYLANASDYQEPKTIISGRSWMNVSAGQNTKLFISPSSKIPRDLIRNTGYKVVIDKDRADYVIIPKIDSVNYSQYSYNLAFKLTDGDLYFVKVNRRDGINKFYEEEQGAILDKIKTEVENADKEIEDFFYDDNFASFKVYFMPKCEEYREIFLGSSPYIYISDDCVELDGATDVSIETLEIWRRMDSEQVFQKSVLNSNWKKYPCTLAIFLSAEKDDFCYRPTGQWAWLLSQIHYDIFENDISSAEMITTPEDWNMLQKWVMYRLNVSNSGGYVRYEDFNSCPLNYKKILLSRLYVKPMYSDSDASFRNLLAKTKDI